MKNIYLLLGGAVMAPVVGHAEQPDPSNDCCKIVTISTGSLCERRYSVSDQNAPQYCLKFYEHGGCESICNKWDEEQ